MGRDRKVRSRRRAIPPFTACLQGRAERRAGAPGSRTRPSATANSVRSDRCAILPAPVRTALPNGPPGRTQVPTVSACSRHTCLTFTLACASALQCFPSKARRRRRAGRRGLPSRDFGSGEERRRPGLPRAAGPRSASRRCAAGREYRPATPTTWRRSPGRRAPQRSRAKAAGRSRPRTHERDGNPRRPATRGLRAPPRPPRFATRRSAQRRRQHPDPLNQVSA